MECPLEAAASGSLHDEETCSTGQNADGRKPESTKSKPKKTKKKTKAGQFSKLNEKYVPLRNNLTLKTLVLETKGFILK